MRILIFANTDEGVYRFRRELLERLVSENNEVFIYAFAGRYVKMIEGLGCKYNVIDFNRKGTNPLADLKLLNQYAKILDDVKPDAVLMYTIKPIVYGGLACQRKHIPYFCTITGISSAVENGGLLRFISLTLYKLGLRKANKVFFQNTTNMEYMIKERVVSKEQCVLVPGSGVNLKQYIPLPYKKKDTIDFAYLGRIMREKGFDQYIDAAKYITKKYPNTRFHVSGMYEDDYKDTIEKLVKENILIYHGNVINMVDEIYANIDCVVNPSFYAEGMSNVLLESCACARAIIATNRPGCGEIIDDKINGFIVKEKDSQDLIEKIEKYINLSDKEKKQLGLNGRKKVEQQFDRQIVVDAYVKELYKCKNQ